MKLLPGLVTLCLFMPCSSSAVDFMSYAEKIVSGTVDAGARSTVLGIADACGTPNNVDDDCVIRGLERVVNEESNLIAAAILSEYARAIDEGHFSTQPECHVETHLQANRILAHCTLLLNYAALKEQSPDAAAAQFNMCLQGGLQGLVYQGNIVSQYMLGQFYSQKGISAPAEVWRRALSLRKNTDEYALLAKCYMQ